MYVVIEGVDGSGKSTICNALSQRLHEDKYDNVVVSAPGATALGKLLRTLVKYPDTIDKNIIISETNKQLLMMADTISSIEEIIIPALNNGKIVISDRTSFISGLVYGIAFGANQNSLMNILTLYKPPVIDKLFILDLPPDEIKRRIALKSDILDSYDKSDQSIVSKGYSDIIEDHCVYLSSIMNIKDIHYINANTDPGVVVSNIMSCIYNDIENAASSKSASS